MSRDDVVRDITEKIMRWQDATQAYDEAVGNLYGLSASERHCLGALYTGPKTAGEIAAAVGLTPAAVTSLLDRLEARGLVKRTRSTEDRRKVMVEYEPEARKLAESHYGAISREGRELMNSFSGAELAVVQRFVGMSLDLQERHLAALTQELNRKEAAGDESRLAKAR